MNWRWINTTTKRLKHVDIAHFYVQELVEKGLMAVKPVAGDKNPADILTKAVPKPLFVWQRGQLGMLELP